MSALPDPVALKGTRAFSSTNLDLPLHRQILFRLQMVAHSTQRGPLIPPKQSNKQTNKQTNQKEIYVKCNSAHQ
jgi:hypothetical protein